MKKLSSILALGCFLLAPAFAGADTKMEANVDFIYGMADSAYDAEGEKADLEGIDQSFMIINMGFNYAVMDGLVVGVDLPIVQNNLAVEAFGIDESTMFIGDPTLGAAYWHTLSDTMAVGGGLDVKLPLGKKADEDNMIPTTDEATHITAKALFSMDPVENLGIDLDAGYIMTIGGPVQSAGDGPELDSDLGDTLFANLYVGYSIGAITPRLGVHFSQTGDLSVDGTTAEDSGNERLSISAEVDYDISDTMTVSAGLGANSINQGTNLPYGYALAAKNVRAGLAFGLGFSAAF